MNDKRKGVPFEHGWPNPTSQQIHRVCAYMRELVEKGRTRRAQPDVWVTACVVVSLLGHASNLQQLLDRVMQGMAAAAPSRDVARIAVTLLHRMQALPDDKAREQYLQMLLGDDDDAPTTTSAGRTAH